ncbi:MAG: curli production assembly/transport component CsgG domain protein [Microcystis aeruginosa W13-16]|nr:curli production assembly/transport component CsgG domain protein [Microcystis aeruginosa W13-16]
MKKHYLVLFTILLEIINCNQPSSDFATLSAPVAYSLAKNAIKQSKPNGKINIVAKWQSLTFENNQWPHGNIFFELTTDDYPGKVIKIQYVFNGSYTATAIISIPKQEPVQYQVNLYESALIVGQASSAEKIIKEIAKNLAPNLRKYKVVIFDFQGVVGEKTLLGKRISESLISHFSEHEIKIVERKLLDPVFAEMNFQNSGLTRIEGDELRNKIGNFLGADVLVTGTIKNEREDLIINARAINISEGYIISATQVILPKYLIRESDLQILKN